MAFPDTFTAQDEDGKVAVYTRIFPPSEAGKVVASPGVTPETDESRAAENSDGDSSNADTSTNEGPASVAVEANPVAPIEGDSEAENAEVAYEAKLVDEGNAAVAPAPVVGPTEAGSEASTGSEISPSEAPAVVTEPQSEAPADESVDVAAVELPGDAAAVQANEAIVN